MELYTYTYGFKKRPLEIKPLQEEKKSNVSAKTCTTKYDNKVIKLFLQEKLRTLTNFIRL